MDNPNTLPSLAHKALASTPSTHSLAALHAHAQALAPRHRRNHRLLRLSPIAALLVLSLGIALHFHQASTASETHLSSTDTAIDLLLLDAYGTAFADASYSSSDRLLLFQEAPGLLF